MKITSGYCVAKKAKRHWLWCKGTFSSTREGALAKAVQMYLNSGAGPLDFASRGLVCRVEITTTRGDVGIVIGDHPRVGSIWEGKVEITEDK